MTNEIPEIHEECLRISKDRLEKIYFLIEKIRKDIYSDEKSKKAAAMVTIHIIISMFEKNIFKDKEVNNNELSELGEEQIPRSNDHRSPQ